MSRIENRETKILLAKEKLKKFQKKKADIAPVLQESINSPQVCSTFLHADHDSNSSTPSASDNRELFSASVQQPEDTRVGMRSTSGTQSQDRTTNGNSLHSRKLSTSSFDVDSEEVAQLRKSVEELTIANQVLRKENDMEKASIESRIFAEHQSLRAQLNSHIQTIGILVAEKTELHAAFTQSEHMAKKKAVEVEKYSAKLAELHQQLMQYERHSTATFIASEKQEQVSSELHHQVEELKSTNSRLHQELDALREEHFQVRRKLNLKESEYNLLVGQNADLESRLETAKCYSEKLLAVSRDHSGVEDVNEDLMREKKLLENRLAEYHKEIGQLQQDMEKMVAQYQSLLAQVTAGNVSKNSVGVLELQLADAVALNDSLNNQIGDLQNDKHQLQQSICSLKNSLNQMQSDVHVLQDNLQAKELGLVDLSRQLTERDEQMIFLHSSNESLQNCFGDREKLLKAMESDRVALSQAMLQNKDLKERLASVMVELEEARTALAKLAQSSDYLMRSCSEAEVQTEPERFFQISAPAVPLVATATHMKSLEGQLHNLEEEIGLYKERVIQADSEVIYLKNTLRMKEEEARLLHLTERLGAYRHLEQRFVSAMSKNAELQEEIDQLQHIIMQLQGESETIGDYIALYQNQRSLQRQRDLEKDLKIHTLIEERQELKGKMAKLQSLVKEQLSRLHVLQQTAYSAGHMEFVQTGDVPDSLEETESERRNSEALEEYVKVTQLPRVSLNADEEIFQLMEDIDTQIRSDPSPSHLEGHTFRSLGHGPYCSCCTGELKTV